MQRAAGGAHPAGRRDVALILISAALSAPGSMQTLLAPARRTRAVDVARWCVRAVSGSVRSAHGHSHGGVPCGGHHAHGPDGPDEAGTLEEGELDDEPMLPPAEPPTEDSGLPVAQRAKNILAANWRGQLSTIELKLGTRRVRAAWLARRRGALTRRHATARLVALQQGAAQARHPRLARALRAAAGRRARGLLGARGAACQGA